ncbi:asparaginyl-tRNA synthetase [Xylographa trunciseda]|nr:asparaginyl-tRNA synthetase [Xylographa trunciseda]
MIWRFPRQSYRHSALPSARLPSFVRCHSSSPVSNLSVANILALPPLSEDQTPRKIVVTGHIRTIRKQKRHSFVELGDGSTIHTLQALLDPPQAVSLGTGTAVTISGSWRRSPQGKEQSHELHAEDVTILGATDPESYPIQKKYHSAEYLRTIPHLRLRTPFHALLARLRSDCEFHVSAFFRANQYIRLQPPVITSSDCEGAGEVFTLRPKDGNKDSLGGSSAGTDEFFRDPKYLTVSSQLHLEAFVHEHQRVWALSPTFRAEKSDTPRHLSEFYMLEAEVRTESIDSLMDLVEDLIRDVAVKVQSSEVGKELLAAKHILEADTGKEMSSRAEIMIRRWGGLKRKFWPRITYSEAIKLLEAAANDPQIVFHFKPRWGSGLQLEHEKFIAAEIGQGSPVFVTDYPKSVKPFYMLPSDVKTNATEDPSATVACFDLLLPEACEVVGGSLREHRLKPLLRAMQEHDLLPIARSENPTCATASPATSPEPSNLDWYVDLRRYGSVPHGGFGLGFDRLLGYLAGVDNIRDVAPWPRYYGKCDC